MKNRSRNSSRMLKRIVGILVISLFITACKKTPSPELTPETGLVTDVQGNVYQTIKIGNQWWMIENLKVTAYSDGTPINEIKEGSNDDWKTDSVGAFTTYTSGTNVKRFLYNWKAIQNKKSIAPEGWHIPSDDEWKELEKQLGMSAEEADKTSWRGTHEGEKLMKEKTFNGTSWTTYGDVWPTNESGFSAVADGCRMFDGKPSDAGAQEIGFWWSSTSFANEAWYRHLDYKNKNIFRYHGPQTYGFSIRCVKN